MYLRKYGKNWVFIQEMREFEETKEGFIIRKKSKKSPFDRWVGYLKHKRDQDPDEIVKELRGHE